MTKPEPKLSHMPLNIKELIFEKIDDWKTKQSLSFVSKDFYSCFKNLPMVLASISLQFFKNKVFVEVRREPRHFLLRIEFHSHERGVLKKNPTNGWEKVVEGEDYRKAAVQFMMEFFKNRKTEVNTLELLSEDESIFFIPDASAGIEFPGKYEEEKFEEDRLVIFDELHSILQRIQFLLLIETLSVNLPVTEHQLLYILSHIKPRHLTYINLDFGFPFKTSPAPFLDLTTICETEQWKQTESVQTKSYITDLPLRKWTHSFNYIQWMEPMASIKELQEILFPPSDINGISIKLSRPFDRNSFAEYIAPLLNDGSQRGRRFDHRMRHPNEPDVFIAVHVYYYGIKVSRVNGHD